MGDLVSEIMSYEAGEMMDDFPRFVELFQNLIDSGMAWTLQGHYGRTARALIDSGHCFMGIIPDGKNCLDK